MKEILLGATIMFVGIAGGFVLGVAVGATVSQPVKEG